MGFLDALRVDKETAHTRLLAWLLDPREDHGLGTSFLRRFWKIAVGDARVPLASATVFIEDRQDETRADFRVSTAKRYVLVENKIYWPAFRRTQIEKHALSGQRRAKRLGAKFHLVLLVPDKGKHKEEIEELRERVAVVVIDWKDIATIARHTALPSGQSAPAASAFLRAYADYIERTILHQWKGFNMSVLLAPVVSAGATYLVNRAALLAELRGFCAAVHEGLDSAVLLERQERKERINDGWIGLLANRYVLPDWRTNVALTFYMDFGAKSRRAVGLRVSFECRQQAIMKRIRKRGLRTQTAAVKRFGSKTESEFTDEYIWVGEEIPRTKWQTTEDTASQSAIIYTRKILDRYLREAQKLIK